MRYKTRRIKLPYKEGDWFAVPLVSGGYAVGLVARMDGKGCVFGYFFGPRYEARPLLEQAERKRREDAILVTQFGDLGLLQESWPVIGASSLWRREDWPMPLFGRTDIVDPSIAYRTCYDEDTLRFVREERVSPDQIAGLPDDSLMGWGSVEKYLTKLLADAPLVPVPRGPSATEAVEPSKAEPAVPQRDSGTEPTVTEAPPMDESRFWDLIEAAKRAAQGDLATEARLLEVKLAQLSETEIISFDRTLREMLARSYDQRLWAAAYIINGGCSDDGFDYFRGWLIAQGRSIFVKALEDPDALAEVAARDVECEDFLYVAQAAYERKTGEPMPPYDRDVVQLKGEDWDEDDLPRKYPRLWSAFGYD